MANSTISMSKIRQILRMHSQGQSILSAASKSDTGLSQIEVDTNFLKSYQFTSYHRINLCCQGRDNKAGCDHFCDHFFLTSPYVTFSYFPYKGLNCPFRSDSLSYLMYTNTRVRVPSGPQKASLIYLERLLHYRYFPFTALGKIQHTISQNIII